MLRCIFPFTRQSADQTAKMIRLCVLLICFGEEAWSALFIVTCGYIHIFIVQICRYILHVYGGRSADNNQLV